MNLKEEDPPPYREDMIADEGGDRKDKKGEENSFHERPQPLYVETVFF
jgi:hypothetical protein